MSVLGVEVTWTLLEQHVVRLGAVAAAIAASGKFIVMPIIRFFQRMERAISNVEEQLYPNGGHSLRDAVSQIQAHLGLAPKLPSSNRHHHPFETDSTGGSTVDNT